MELMVGLDHPYSRHWSESYKTDTSHANPIQWLLPACRKNAHVRAVNRRRRFPHSNQSNLSSDGSEDEIDVESLDEVMSPYTPGRTYDVQRARQAMNETQRLTTQSLLHGKHSVLDSRSEANFEDSIEKSSWSVSQNKMYSKVLKLLEDEKLARLAYKGVSNEPIARRLSLDRSASCLRRIFSEFSWDQKLTQWLHSLLTTKLPAGMLASYLDLIQTLRSKVPALVERMIMQSSSDSSSIGSHTLNILLKRPWEPSLIKYRLAPRPRLYEPPVILVIPNSPYAPSPTMVHRKRFWNTHLSELGKLPGSVLSFNLYANLIHQELQSSCGVLIYSVYLQSALCVYLLIKRTGNVVSVLAVPSPDKSPDMTILSYVEQLAASVQSRIRMVRNKHPSRPIVLFGWHTASVLSCHISLVEKVSAVICLGFPMKTLNGPRGKVDDILCDMTTPTLFVAGEDADSCSIDKLEDFREQLLTRCENYLLAIPGADDALKVNEKVKRRAFVTQQMVDRMMLDYVSKFFSEVLIKSAGNWRLAEPVRGEDVNSSSTQRRKRRKNSEDFESLQNKRKKLSSATSARIAEVLSGQPYGRVRDGTRSPVQGVSYNLRTGSISGMATVPNVLGRSLSKPGEQMSSVKSKGGGRNQGRSITIDLEKDPVSQLKIPKSYGVSPDPSLLASAGQTEAAVATILGTDFSSDKKLPTPSNVAEENELEKKENQSDFTSSAPSGTTTASLVTGSDYTPASSSSTAPDHDTIQPSQHHDFSSKIKPAYTNVRFNSTVISKSSATAKGAADTGSLTTINKQDWAGILDSATKSPSAASDFPRPYPLVPTTAAETSTHVTSRSRKEERETMQATAILEKLTSGIDNDTEQNDQSGSNRGLARAANYRRHSCGANFISTARGRGRVRTRGGSSHSALVRDALKRRKTITADRPTPYYQQKTTPATVHKTSENVTRYVVSSGVSALFTNSTTKIIASNKLNQTPIATMTPIVQTSKQSSKPSILPVYTFTQPASSSALTIRNPTAISTAKASISAAPAKIVHQAAVKKPAKVIVGQRLPVKFPGAVPGSSYTFVTIPALAGPSLPVTGQKMAQLAAKKVAINQAKMKKDGVKYSVIPRSNVAVASKTPIAISTKSTVPVGSSVVQTQQVAVAIRSKALPAKSATAKPTIIVSSANPNQKSTSSATVPILTSPASVVLHKLWKDTVAEMGPQASEDQKK